MSIRALIRRLLGRRGTFFLRNTVSEISHALGIYEDPGKRPEGISAMVLTYNEEDWIEPSLLSIKDLVDEYIVADSSSDETPNTISRLRDERGLNIRLFKVPPGSIPEVRNRVLQKASYKWILVWDADFVLFEWAAGFVRSLIESLDRKRHYLIYWPLILLCGDPWHVCEKPYHIEHWIYTWSPKIKYKYVGRTDSLIAPLYLYKAIHIKKPLGLHINARNPKRTAIKQLWHMFRERFEKAGELGKDHETIAKEMAMSIYGTDDLEAVGVKIIKDAIKNLKPYEPEIYGDYPSVLKPHLSKWSSFELQDR